MIKSLRLQNFQSHKDSYLEFSPGINIITGKSNNGKTAILRALGWIVFNRPQGLSFKSTFADKGESCKVTLVINDSEIIREKNTSLNSYKVGISLFDTIGNDIPSEVSSAINLSEMNIHTQFEKHFLLTDSAGEVGRTINKIVKLDDIDALISSISSKISSTNKEIEIKKIDIERLNKDLEKFKDFDKIENLVNILVKNDSEIKELEQKVKVLNYIISEGSRTEKTILNIENKYDTLEEEIVLLEEMWLDCNTNIVLIKDLTTSIKEYDIIESKNNLLETILINAEALEDIEENVIKYATSCEYTKQLNKLVTSLDVCFKNAKKYERIIEKEEVEFKKILKEAGICPLCGNIFN